LQASKVKDHFPIAFTGTKGNVAHEFIIDLRPFKVTSHHSHPSVNVQAA